MRAPIAYSDRFILQLPLDHRFPIQKYATVKEQLIYEGTATQEYFHDPGLIADELIQKVHSESWWNKIAELSLSRREWRKLGLPPTATNLFERSKSSCAGTLFAALTAQQTGLAYNLAGGTHHAFQDYGEGFSVFNDLVIAGTYLLDEGLAHRIAIVDLDVHQGNGTAALVGQSDAFFTFSMHGAANYPLQKQQSHLDVPLPSTISGEAYLDLLGKHLEQEVKSFEPDFIFYQAGVDILEGDNLGKLSLSLETCQQRDELVFRFAQQAGIPIAVTMGGGYNSSFRKLIEAHCNTFRTGFKLYEF